MSTAPPFPPPELIHVDDHLIVAVKPAGLLSVPGRGADKADCLATWVQSRHADALTVHRLDMATSGLILMARGPDMHRALNRAFAGRAVHKTYIAVVNGCMAADQGEIDLPLVADWPNRPRQMVDHAIGKPSLTRWQVMARDTAAVRTRVALFPVTGRSHQLRVHLSAIGHAILGDDLYAAPDVLAASPRLLLHASALRLAHPADGRPLAFDSAAPF